MSNGLDYVPEEELEAFESYLPTPVPEEDEFDFPLRPPGYQEPVQGVGDRIALALQGNIPNIPTTRLQGQPSGALPGFLAGLARGYSGARTREISEREKLNKILGQVQHEKNVARIQASREARAEGRAIERETRAETRTTTREQAKFERDNPVVDAEFRKKYPAAKDFPEGVRLTPEVFQKVQTAQLPETPAEKKAGEARERAARNEERVIKSSEITNAGKQTDQYEADPDVKGFPTIRDSFNVGMDAVSRKNSAGDIILMRMIAKATDPTTGVREEEFRTFQGAQGKLAQYGVTLTREMWGKGTLNDYGREQLSGVLQDIYDRKLGNYEIARDFHRNRVQKLGGDADLLIRDYTVSAPRKKKLTKAEKDAAYKSIMGGQ